MGSGSELDSMIVSFAANFDDLTSAENAIGAAFDRLASNADQAASQISSSMSGAAEGFGALSEAANSAGIDIGDGIQVSYEALDELAAVSEETASSVSSSFSSVNFDAFQGALQSLTAAIDAAVAQIDEKLATIPEQAQQDADKTETAFNGIHLGGMLNQIGMTIFSLQNVANVAEQLGSALLGPAMNAENVTTALTTLDGSAQKAAQEMDNLDAFAAKTPFKTLDIDQAAEQLQGFGYNANAVVPTIKAIGDALGSVGKETPAELMSVVDIFGKMKTEGKITAMQMNELAVHGINGWQALADASGLPIAKLKEMVSKGILPANEAVGWLTKGIEKNPLYKGGMAKQSSTLAGIMSTLSSDWDVFMSKVVGPALPFLEKGLTNLANILTNPQFQKFATEVGTTIVNGLKNFATWVGNLISAGQGLYNFFSQNHDALNALIAVLISGAGVILGVLIPAFAAWAIAMFPVMIETLATAAPFILLGVIVAAVIFGIIEAVQHWGEIAHWLQGIWKHIAQFFQDDVVTPVGNLFNNLGTNIHNIIGKIGDFFSGLGTTVHNIVGKIGDAFSGLGTTVHNVWDGIIGAIKGAINGVIWLINQFIGGIDSLGIDVGPVHIHPNIPKIPYLAAGGYVAPGSVAVAGDAGPELVFGGASGAHVLSNAQSAALVGSGGGKQPIYVFFQIDGRTIAGGMLPDIANGIINATRSGHPVGEVA